MVRDLEPFDVLDEPEAPPRVPPKARIIASAVLRTLQLAVGFTTLFLAGYATSVFKGDFYHSFAVTFVSFVWTLLLLIFAFLVPRWLPKWNVYWIRLSFELIALAFWLSSFSLLVWECMEGDTTFAVLGDIGDPVLQAYLNAGGVRTAIMGLKVATVLACVNWVAFIATAFICRSDASARCTFKKAMISEWKNFLIQNGFVCSLLATSYRYEQYELLGHLQSSKQIS